MSIEKDIDKSFGVVKTIFKALAVFIVGVIGLLIAIGILSGIWGYFVVATVNSGIVGFLVSAAIFIGIPVAYIIYKVKQRTKQIRTEAIPPVIPESSDDAYVPEGWK